MGSVYVPVFAIVSFLAMSPLWPMAAWGHAFPEHTMPAAGARLDAAPVEVEIRFDRRLEVAFSSIRVRDAQGRRVDRKDVRLAPEDQRTLRVGLPRLAPGTYRVQWTAVALDGHRTQGDYRFTIRPPH